MVNRVDDLELDDDEKVYQPDGQGGYNVIRIPRERSDAAAPPPAAAPPVRVEDVAFQPEAVPDDAATKLMAARQADLDARDFGGYQTHPAGGFRPQPQDAGNGATSLTIPGTDRTGFRGPNDQGYVFNPVALTPQNDPRQATGLADWMARTMASADLNTQAGQNAYASAFGLSDQGIRHGSNIAGIPFQAGHNASPPQPEQAAPPASSGIPGFEPHEGMSQEQFEGLAAATNRTLDGAQGDRTHPYFNGSPDFNAQPAQAAPPRFNPIIDAVERGANLAQDAFTQQGAQNPAVQQAGISADPVMAKARDTINAALSGQAVEVGRTNPGENGETYPILGQIMSPYGVASVVDLGNGLIRIWTPENGYEDPTDPNTIWARLIR